MKKRFIATLIAAMTIMSLALAGCGEQKVKPTFMYFTSGNDANTEAAVSVVKELEEKYTSKVNFEIINIDEDPEAAENFALVVGNTPALIMLNTSNDISAIQLKCDSKETLEQNIRDALK